MARLLPVVLLVLLLTLTAVARTGVAALGTGLGPTIEECRFIPDPATNVSINCAFSTSDVTASPNVPVFFEVNVSGSADNTAVIGLSVTFYFDYRDGAGGINELSPSTTVYVVTPGDGTLSSVNTTWTYTAPNANLSDSSYVVHVEVMDDYGGFDSTYGWTEFPVFVTEKSQPPSIQACRFVPDPRTNASVDCGASSSATDASPHLPVFFEVNVSGSTDNTAIVVLNVTFYFDYWTDVNVVNPSSPNRTFEITTPGDGTLSSVNTTWTYAAPNANFSLGYYWVYVEVRNGRGEPNPTFPSIPFPVYVVPNYPPYIDGLSSVNTVHGTILPANPVIPLVYENVSVGDRNGDAVTVTWDWGDGTVTVNRTGPLPAYGTLALNVTHAYAASFLPLNESPRFVDIPLHVWVDDGQGENVTAESLTEFSIGWDRWPTPIVTLPEPGSVWKVGEVVRMAGNVTDPEGDPTTAFWDFDNRTDSTHIGDPLRNVDAPGTTASHAYTSPGNYSITLWATDGEKLYCGLDPLTCANGTTHWRSFVVPIEVLDNRPPILGLSNATTTVGELLSLRASVFDWDGDNLTVRWVFGDGTTDAFNYTGNSSRKLPSYPILIQDHAYLEPGAVNFTVFVSDGNATVNATMQVFVQSFNLPPVVLRVVLSHANGTESKNNTFRLNETVRLVVYAFDPENDTLNVSVDWADGGSGRGVIDPKTGGNCTNDNLSRRICSVSFTHAYTDIGGAQFHNYTVAMRLTDGRVYLRENLTGGPPTTLNHTKAWSVTVFITDYQMTGLGPWDWWDYSTLVAVLALPSLLLVRFAWKVRRERQEA